MAQKVGEKGSREVRARGDVACHGKKKSVEGERKTIPIPGD